MKKATILLAVELFFFVKKKPDNLQRESATITENMTVDQQSIKQENKQFFSHEQTNEKNYHLVRSFLYKKKKNS